MKKGRINVTVLYPFSQGKSFNMDYYLDKHVKLVKNTFGDLLKAAWDLLQRIALNHYRHFLSLSVSNIFRILLHL